MGFWMMESVSDNDAALEERLLTMQERARKAEERCLGGLGMNAKGKFYPQPYPWITADRSRRSDELVGLLNEEFATSASAVGSSQPLCQVRQHAFGDTGPASKDILGVFATQDIPAHTTILHDTTHILGCCGPGAGGDMANLGGALACGDPVHPNLPDEGAELDLRWVRDETGTGATSTLLTIRLLLAALQDGVHHPLDHSLVARLTPNYRDPDDEGIEPESFYLASDIAVPLRALQQFGIDIFAQLEWDTWVLFTVSQRQLNNVCGDAISGSLMPLFSLFNHSCEPNVEWSRVMGKRDGGEEMDDWGDPIDAASWSVDHETVTVTTAWDIRKGEQLFVEYDSFEHDHAVTDRRRRLRKWLSGDCMCTRCVKEAGAEERGKMKGIVRRDSPFGRKERAWDDGEKVELPEDDEGFHRGTKLNMW